MNRTRLYSSLVVMGFLIPLVGDQWRTRPVVTAEDLVSQPAVRVDLDNWKFLARAVERRAAHFEGSLGYLIKDLKTGEVVSTNATAPFPSASLIKLPIMAAIYRASTEGKLDLNASYRLQESDKRGGSGILKRKKAGTRVSYRELIEVMIIHSDNTATEFFVRRLGIPYLRETFQRLGLDQTEVHPTGFKLQSQPVLHDNVTSPRDMAKLLEQIYRGDLISPEASREMLDILKKQKLRDRLPKFLPLHVPVAHKTGLLRKSCHDVGIVFSSNGDYVICVLTANDESYRAAKDLIASLGRITYTFYRDGMIHAAELIAG